jgi:hypothetical protein
MPKMIIDAVPKDIEKGRGVFYEATFADACLRLFWEKDFQRKNV